MKFRTHFNFITANTSPNEGICGEPAINSEGDDTNLALTIKVGGVEVLNIPNLSGFTNAIVNVPSIGNVTVDRFDSTGIVLGIPLANIWDTTTVSIIAAKANYYTYNNSFQIFGYDLGNDVLNGITTNLDMDIIMLYDWSALPSQVGNVTSKFVAYRKPFSNKIFAYNLVSFSSQVETAVQNYTYCNSDESITLGTEQNIMLCNANSQDIRIKTSIGHITNGSYVEDDYCIIPTQTIVPFNSLKLPFAVQTECGTCATDCIPIGDAYNAYTLFNNSPSFWEFNKDDVAVPPYDEMTLTYDLYDLFGNLVTTQSYTIPVTLPFTPDAGNYPFTGIPLTEVGDHVLKVTLSVDGLFTCVKPVVLEGCVKVEVARDCNTFTLTNITLSQQSTTLYNVSDLTGSEIIDLITNDTIPPSITPVVYTIPANSTKTIVGVEDGYYILLTDGVYHLLLVTCSLETCIANYIKKIICSKPKCGCGGDCGKNCSKVEQDTYNLNAIVTMLMVWLSSNQANYLFSKAFTGQELGTYFGDFNNPNVLQLDMSFNTKYYLDKAKEYCELCQLNKKTGCGC